MSYYISLFFIFLGGLCWGSFLNCVAHRLTHNKKLFTKRSQCPSCHHVIAWYDNIPLISWVILKRRCRSCQAHISFLYPAIELLTAGITLALYLKYYARLINHTLETGLLDYTQDYIQALNLSSHAFSMYYIYISLVIFIIFFSALIIAIRTDLESMVIPQLCTLWLVPIGIIGAFFSFTGISFYESLSGALIGYGVLWLIAFIFKLCTKREGMGIGDMELLAMIGSFLGPWGVWFTLMISSFSGLAVGALYLVFTKQSTLTRIPFGPFLALGAFIYFFFEKNLIHFFLLH